MCIRDSILGAALDESLKDEIVITVIATGFENAAKEEKPVNLFSNPVFSGGASGSAGSRPAMNNPSMTNPGFNSRPSFSNLNRQKEEQNDNSSSDIPPFLNRNRMIDEKDDDNRRCRKNGGACFLLALLNRENLWFSRRK